MLTVLCTQSAEIMMLFPYFVNKIAPISKAHSLMNYEISWVARAIQDQQVEFELIIQVPITSLCPCSKKIARYGAHNQRSHVIVSVVFNEFPSIPNFIRLIENEGSCELWGILKRSDEKYVTEHAYNNPKFVEDVVRNVAFQIDKFPNIIRYQVEVENFAPQGIHMYLPPTWVEGVPGRR